MKNTNMYLLTEKIHGGFHQILCTALIQSAKNFVYSHARGYLCYFKFGNSSTQIINLSLYRYKFEGCYFGAIMGSAKIGKIKCL